MTTTRIHIERKSNENNLGALRRFRNRVKSSGVINSVRSLRFHARPETDFKQKKNALRRIKRRKERERLIKLGKISEL